MDQVCKDKNRSYVRQLDIADMPEASELMWKSYYFSQKNLADLRVVEAFRNVVDLPVLQQEILLDTARFFGAYEAGRLCGVAAVRADHLLLLFVRHDLFGGGLGSMLLDYAAKQMTGEEVTVNSSDFAIGFYQRFGFEITGERTVKDGIPSTPMKAERKRLFELINSYKR